MNQKVKLESISEDELVSELWARDVRFLMGKQTSISPLLTPSNLIASLAQSENARVRLALIPLLLRHPEFSIEVIKADESLFSQFSKIVLHFYYTAASILQRKYQEQLRGIFGEQIQLPDLYSNQLGVSLSESHEQSLVNLAKRHQTLSGQHINWLGTYEHAAERLIKHMEKFK
jgi:hypothetical protein